MFAKFFLIFVCLVSSSTYSQADESNHKYTEGDEVVLWMNTVGPQYNRQETYTYFSLPFCQDAKGSTSRHHETLSETLQGEKLVFSGYKIEFKNDVPPTDICTMKLEEDQVKAFTYAVMNEYWYELYIDGVPIRGRVGEEDLYEQRYYIYTHKKFDIGYSGNQIVEVNLTSWRKRELLTGEKLYFSYEVNWMPSMVEFKFRFDRYLDPLFFEQRIHWFSIYNSFMTILFMVALVAKILMATLRNDCARYSKDEEEAVMERDLVDQYGWRLIHGEVFRNPPHSLIFSAMIGVGCQLIAVVFFVLLFAVFGEWYTKRASMLSNAIFVYVATSPINGYAGGSLYARFGGRRWIRQMMVSAFMVPVAASATALSINCIALSYHASRAIPFGTMVAVLCICVFVILPLTLVGTVVGRNFDWQAAYPCRVNAFPRPIPEKKWFMEPAIIILLGGVLPYSAVYIEMYFIFASVWAYKIYFLCGFILLVFAILIIVTVCVTIVSTYFLLNAEDYRWQWTSFLASASTSIYVYAFSFYYFINETKMYGLFQTAFFFGYMALYCAALGVICGTVGYIGTSVFVRKIYSNVKKD